MTGGWNGWNMVELVDHFLEVESYFRNVYQPMANCWFGARWFGILGVHPSSNPFHKGILGIQTTNLVFLPCYSQWETCQSRKQTLNDLTYLEQLPPSQVDGPKHPPIFHPWQLRNGHIQPWHDMKHEILIASRGNPHNGLLYFGLYPFPVLAPTRILTSLVGDPCKPPFATITGKGDHPNHNHYTTGPCL